MVTMEKELKNIDTWMIRKEGEVFSLLLSLILVIIVGYLLSIINLWATVGFILINLVVVKLQQQALLGNALRVHAEQFPEIYELAVSFAKKLNTPKVTLYIQQSPGPNAFTFGYPKSSIVITSAIIENLDIKEIAFVLAHEFGHIKAGHNVVNLFISPIGSGITSYWNFLFSLWKRKAEYTADRCGLVLTKDINSSIKTMLKLSSGLKVGDKVNIDAYRKQIITADRTFNSFGEMIQDHPYTTNRIRELIKFSRESFVKYTG